MESFSKCVGVFLLTMLVAVGGSVLFNKDARNAAIDFSVKNWLSDEDYKAFKDPQAADKAFQKDMRELWQRSQAQQPPISWDHGWQPPKIDINPQVRFDPPRTGTFQPRGWNK